MAQCLLHVVALDMVAALGLVMDLLLELVVALVQVAAADPTVALDGVALAHAVAVEPSAAQELGVDLLPVVVFIGRAVMGVGDAVAWCCVSLAQSAPGPSIPSTSPF